MISTLSFIHIPTQEYVVPRSIPMAGPLVLLYDILDGMYVFVKFVSFFFG